MAIALTQNRVFGRHTVDAVLLDAVGATADGEWVGVEGVFPLTVHVSGITTATVQVRFSNKPTKPANNTHELLAGSNVTSDQAVSVEMPCKWIKAMVSAYTSGTISAWMHGVLS